MPLGHFLTSRRLLAVPFAILASTFCALRSGARTAQPYLFVEVPPSPARRHAGMLACFRSDSIGALTLLSSFSQHFESAVAAEPVPAPISQPPPPQQQTATPTIQPTGGTFSAPQTVSIADSTASSTINFTTDGSAPTTSLSVYSAPFSLNSAATVKAMAAAPSYNSSVQSVAFSFRSPAGTYSITVNATATASGSNKSMQLTPIVLTLDVN